MKSSDNIPPVSHTPSSDLQAESTPLPPNKRRAGNRGESHTPWTFKNPDPQKVQEIASRLRISPVLATLLLNRGIQTPREAELFLNPDLSKMHNPFLLPDMEKAVLRLRKAIDHKEKILIYGDRDVDGVTSTAILVRTLKNMGAEVAWTLPQGEGHGLNHSVLEKHKEQNFKLLITADCGTTAQEEIEFANSLGMEVIVTDHHLPDACLPPAFAVVNPNLNGSLYPFREVAGCMVAFKFAYAAMFTFNRTFNQEFVVVDLETTGLSPQEDRIVEIGAVCLRNFVPIAKFHSLIRSEKPISAGALAVHGITEEMVSHAPSLKEIFPSFLKFIGERILIAHNAKFDLAFLQNAAKEILQSQLPNPAIDTLAISRDLLPNRSHALSSLAADLFIDLPKAHRAMDDCYATAALFQKLEEMLDPRLQFFLEDQLDLATLGTIADLAPLIDENRILVKWGLPRLLQTKKIGLRKLMEQVGMKYPTGMRYPSRIGNKLLTPQQVSRGLTPLINAAGRLAQAEVAAKLLLTEKEGEACQLVEEIFQLNEERRILQKVNLKKFFQLAEEQCDLQKDPILIVLAEGLEHGVTGIVASRMSEQYQKPVILLLAIGGEAQGSARSREGFNVKRLLDSCKDLLLKYGGHPQAAGLSLRLEQMEEFKQRLKKAVALQQLEEPVKATIEIDMELKFESIDPGLLKDLSLLAPFGKGNPPPIFLAKGVQIAETSSLGSKKNEFIFSLKQENKLLQALYRGESHSPRESHSPWKSEKEAAFDILLQPLEPAKEEEQQTHFVIVEMRKERNEP